MDAYIQSHSIKGPMDLTSTDRILTPSGNYQTAPAPLFLMSGGIRILDHTLTTFNALAKLCLMMCALYPASLIEANCMF